MDFWYYVGDYFNLLEIFNKSKTPVYTINEISKKIVDGPFGSQLKVEEYQQNWVPLIRVKDIKNWRLLENDFVYISESKQKQLIRSKVNPWDIILTKAWSVWNAVVFPEHLKEWNITSHLAKIEPKENVDPYYLALYLDSNFGKSQIIRLWNKTTRPELNIQEVKTVKIILPELDIQRKIVEKMNQALIKKQKLEEENVKIIKSIDEYILWELWIELIKKQIEKTFFVTDVADLKNGRFDPFFHNPKFKITKNIKTKYELKKFKEIVTELKTWLPIRKDQRVVKWTIPYYWANWIIWRMSDFTHNWEYLVIAQDGYIGNHYVVNWKFWASNHNRVAKTKEDINIRYLKYILDITNYEYLVTWWVIPKLTKEALEQILIPVPPINIQTKIADEVSRRIEEAKLKEQQAKEIYENAKREVEKMILW